MKYSVLEKSTYLSMHIIVQCHVLTLLFVLINVMKLKNEIVFVGNFSLSNAIGSVVSNLLLGTIETYKLPVVVDDEVSS